MRSNDADGRAIRASFRIWSGRPRGGLVPISFCGWRYRRPRLRLAAARPSGETRARSPITSTSALSAFGTPSPATAESNSGVFFAARFRRSRCFFNSCRRQPRRSCTGRRSPSLSASPAAIGLELVAHGVVGLAGMLRRCASIRCSSTRQRSTWPRKRSPRPRAFMRALDQAGDVGQHELAPVALDDAEAADAAW